MHQHIQLKRFDGENCKTEADFYGGLARTIIFSTMDVLKPPSTHEVRLVVLHLFIM